MSLRDTAIQARRDLPNLLSLFLFFGATALIFRSVEFALVVTASLGFHELGHATLLSWHGLEWRISFGLVGAWTWSPHPERARLSQVANISIHLAGPAFSLLLALAALGVHTIWLPDSPHLLILANFSAQVGFLNLLPLGHLTDGGKAIWRMVASLDGPRRSRAVMLPFYITAAMLILYTFIQLPGVQSGGASPFLLGLLLVGLWMASSLLIETSRANAAQPAVSQPMIPRQVDFFIFLTWSMLALSLIVISSTPFWLNARYLLGPVESVIGLARLFADLIRAVLL